MTIRPINAVNNYSNLAFASSKRNNNNSTNTVKAASIAALLTMSPMNQDTFAYEPNSSAIEEVLNIQQSKKKHYLPSNFKNIGSLSLAANNGSTLKLDFFDTDNDDDKFEMVEYKHIAEDGHIIKRGIAQKCRFNDRYENSKSVTIYGVILDAEDLDNYKPEIIFKHHIISEEVYQCFKNIVLSPHNSAVGLLAVGESFGKPEVYGPVLRKYQRMVGLE